MEKVYISGPISGYDLEERINTFSEEENKLKETYDCEVVNPLTDLPEGKSWEEYMLRDLKMMLECDTIAMLPGWENSRGAKLEFLVATSLGMEYIIDGVKERVKCDIFQVNSEPPGRVDGPGKIKNAVIYNGKTHIPTTPRGNQDCEECSLRETCQMIEDCPADVIFGEKYGPNRLFFQEAKEEGGVI